MNGSEETNLMIGGNVIDDNFRRIAVDTQLEGISKLVEGANWEKPTKLNIAKNLVERIEELLDGKAHYFECSDRTTYHQKIVIEYNHSDK
jgi:hypothetical protein